MADIYQKAHQVLIWLGEAADDSDLAMEFMKDISTREIDQLSTPTVSYTSRAKNTAKILRAIRMLLERDWFSRRWIVQEVALARDALVCCGTQRLPWQQFSEVVDLFIESLDSINELFRRGEKKSKSWMFARIMAVASGIGMLITIPINPGYAIAGLMWDVFVWMIPGGEPVWGDKFRVGEVCEGGAYALISSLRYIVYKDASNDSISRPRSMGDLLLYLPAFKATEPRDVVFATASLAKDSEGLLPDYEQPVVQVYKNAVQQAVATSGSLNIICRPWAQPVARLPSWIPQLCALPIPRDQGICNSVRQHPDSLVCLPHHQNHYRASRERQASASFSNNEDNYVLTVKGFQLSVIDWLGDLAGNGVLPSSWSESFEKSNVQQQNLKDIYWQTLVANRGFEWSPTPSWYRRACNEVYELSPDRVLNTAELLRKTEEKEMETSTRQIKFLRRVQAVTWNRRLVRLKGDSLGLVPERTRKDDHICILFGCDVPVVLRKLQDGYWEFIGEAFVHGKGEMDGLAMERPFEEVAFNLK
jgi:hypothetical protein